MNRIINPPVILFAGLIACAPTFVKPVSFFSKDIPLSRDVKDDNAWIYQNPSQKAVAYSKFLIEPAKIISNAPSSSGFNPTDEQEIAASFRSQLITALKDGYDIVEKPGPDVLRIQTAILDIQPAHVELDEEKFLVLRMDTLLARVSMELYCTDAVTGERVAVLIHKLHEGQFRDKQKKKRLLNIRDAFSAWTQDLRERFDAAKRRPSADLDGPDHDVHRRIKAEEGE